jgi:hypothetical protein
MMIARDKDMGFSEKRRTTTSKRIDALREAIRKREAEHVELDTTKIDFRYKHRDPNDRKYEPILPDDLYESDIIGEIELPFEGTIINFIIDEEPLTPQALATTFTALTELVTKLWLIGKHRFADLIEYTQTHDVRFANEAGTKIAWVTYNSPLNLGLNVEKVVPGIAEAIMTIVDGLSQRKAHLEKLELENMATAQKIKEAEENLKQQVDMATLEREKQELAIERLRLENEKERQAIVEGQLESQKKQIMDALEYAGNAVKMVYPEADMNLRPILIQTVMNNILQLQSVSGLKADFIYVHNSENDSTKEDTGQ